MNIIEISSFQLFVCLGFVLIAGVGSFVFKLGLEKDLVWGTIRTFAQLILVGYVLTFIFDIENPLLVLLYYVWMIFWAAQTIRGRVNESNVPIFAPTFVSMVVTYMLVAVLVTGTVLQVRPWYSPQYFIPLGGMIIGNSMNAISIALDRLFSDLRKQSDEIELAFCFGATYDEATRIIFRDVIRAGMIPSINAMMTVGLVSLPGMMTGQILAGTPPMTAIKYQILVMLMLVASTALGCVIVVALVRKRCFTKHHQLSIDH